MVAARSCTLLVSIGEDEQTSATPRTGELEDYVEQIKRKKLPVVAVCPLTD
jgi:hypothetical protein